MGYYEEKRRYEQNTGDTVPQVNKCQKCKKGILITTITQGLFRKSKTTFKSFCPICGNTIKKVV